MNIGDCVVTKFGTGFVVRVGEESCSVLLDGDVDPCWFGQTEVHVINGIGVNNAKMA